MTHAITIVLSNLLPLLFAAAFGFAALSRNPVCYEARLLDWMLLLFVGIGGVWAGVFHVFFPHIASASIGWVPSPFETEIGIADIAMGATAIAAFWQARPFKAAIVLCIVLFYIGVAINHIYGAATAGNVSANNFGLLLVCTLANIFMLPLLYRRSSYAIARR